MDSASNWLEVQPVEDDEDVPRINSLSCCMTLCDVTCDNYVRLLAVDILLDDYPPLAKLKVYRGTKQTFEQSLTGLPSSIVSLYVDESEPKTPIIAIAIAESILFFRHLKPFFKYTLPSVEAADAEKDLWLKLSTVRLESQAQVIESLKAIDHSRLSRKSQKLLQLAPEDRNNFIMKHAESPVERYPNIVAMCCLERVSSETNPPSHLVVATSDGDVLILEAQAFSVLSKAKICSYQTAPSLMAVHGTYETDFRIVVATRSGAVYLLRKAAAEGQEIFKMLHPLTGLLILPIEQTIVVSSVEERLVCYSKKGKQLYSLPLTAMPVCLLPITLTHLGMTLICVALEGGLVQFYMQRYLVDELQLASTASAVLFGPMGLEEHVLTIVTVEGSLLIKILKRTASFEPNQQLAVKYQADRHSIEASILDKPKKSSIFVEQAAREKQNAQATYGSFQVELWRLRYTAARATVQAINSAESAISGDITHAPVKLSAEVCGSGPVFYIFLTLQNLSSYKMASNLTVVLHTDRRHFTIPKSTAKLPSILPGIPLKIVFEVTAVLDPMDKLPPHSLTPENCHIRVIVLKAQQAKPLIAACIAMPQSEANF